MIICMCIYTVGSLWGAWTSVLIIEVFTSQMESLCTHCQTFYLPTFPLNMASYCDSVFCCCNISNTYRTYSLSSMNNILKEPSHSNNTIILFMALEIRQFYLLNEGEPFNVISFSTLDTKNVQDRRKFWQRVCRSKPCWCPC